MLTYIKTSAVCICVGEETCVCVVALKNARSNTTLSRIKLAERNNDVIFIAK